MILHMSRERVLTMWRMGVSEKTIICMDLMSPLDVLTRA